MNVNLIVTSQEGQNVRVAIDKRLLCNSSKVVETMMGEVWKCSADIKVPGIQDVQLVQQFVKVMSVIH